MLHLFFFFLLGSSGVVKYIGRILSDVSLNAVNPDGINQLKAGFFLIQRWGFFWIYLPTACKKVRIILSSAISQS